MLSRSRTTKRRAWLRRLAVRAAGVVVMGTAAAIASPLGIRPAAASGPPALVLSPATVTVPADGSMQGGITATYTNPGNPISGVVVTVTSETDSGTGHDTSCTTDHNGNCLIHSNHDSTIESGTVTATVPGLPGSPPTATVNFVAPGNAATGLTMSVANGNGASAPLAAGDTFSDNNHYLIEETSGHANYDATQSEAVVSAPLTGATGNEPWAINWSIHNTGGTPLYIDAVQSVPDIPQSRVICTAATQSDPHGSSNCNPLSYDLDTNKHYSNPANPAMFGVGALNNTMLAGQTTIPSGVTETFTTYMIGANNNAEIVLDSPDSQPAAATVSAQAANDPAGSTTEGSTIGSLVTSNLVWAAVPSGTSVSGSFTSVDGNSSGEAGEPGTSDPTHDWVALNVSGTPTLANFDQTTGQAYSANGITATEAGFESDLGTPGAVASFAATGYGSVGQTNSLSGDSLSLTPTSLTVPADGSMEGAVTALVTDASGHAASGVPVSVTGESDSGSGHSANCTTNVNGQCTLFTNHDLNIETGSLTAMISGPITQSATVNFATRGSAPTALNMVVSNGDGLSAPLAAGDAFSDGSHYLIQESGASPGDFDATQAESIVGAQLASGSNPLSSGSEPYAINWTVHNTGSNSVLMDAVSTVATLPSSSVVCTSGTQADSSGSPSCTANSFNLDSASHFSNPSNPGVNDVGINNGTLLAGHTAIAAGSTLTFTSYMTGGNNDAFVVLDSPTNTPAAATVSAQLATDPFQQPIEGSSIGSASSVGLQWLPAASGPVTGTILAHDSNLSAPDPDPTHDWLVLNVSGTSELANYGQGGQTFAANGTPISEATFENDLATATFPTYTNNGSTDSISSSSISNPPPSQGYWMIGSDGGVFAFGNAGYLGSLPGLGVHVNNVVGVVPTHDNGGYWMIGSDGGVFAFGDANFVGSLPGLGVHVNNIVGVIPTATGKGYWMVGSDGGVFAFGDATFVGSLPGLGIHVHNIVGVVPTASNKGYWMVGSDGGVFAFGDATFVGSLPALHVIASDIVGVVPTHDGGGYWMVGSDGGVFAFGDASFVGSLPGLGVTVNDVVAVVPTVTGRGYWMVGRDGGVFAFGDAGFLGSLPGLHVVVNDIVGVVHT